MDRDLGEAPFTFVVPHFGTSEDSLGLLAETLAGIRAQTDPRWRLCLVDDASPIPGLAAKLRELVRPDGDRATLLLLDQNAGPGACRNLAVGQAFRSGSPVVLFNDADDVSHPDRVRVVRDVLRAEPEVDFVYSTIEVVDERLRPVDRSALPPPIAEILESHEQPVEGAEAWIRIATETGYTNPTSSTAVRTGLAAACPFPAARASEDSHAWLRMSASGAVFRFAPQIPTRYRIPTFVSSQSSRDLLGNDWFNREKVRRDTEGLFDALQLAAARGAIDRAGATDVAARFFLRLAVTLERDGARDVAELLTRAADRIRAGGLAAFEGDPVAAIFHLPTGGPR